MHCVKERETEINKFACLHVCDRERERERAINGKLTNS